jgi:hypothetical protein
MKHQLSNTPVTVVVILTIVLQNVRQTRLVRGFLEVFLLEEIMVHMTHIQTRVTVEALVVGQAVVAQAQRLVA